jgi:hypothetical protein
MGFLRKVGRKIKKGVKKLFSSKFGRIIGGIGLSLMLGPVISRAFNGIKGFFTKGVADTTAGQITTTATTSAGGTTTAATGGGAGGAAVVDNTVSGAVDKIVNVDDLLIDFESGVGLKGDASLGGDIASKVASAVDKGPTIGQEIRQNFVNLGESVKEFGQDPIGKTKSYLGEEFIPDTARSVAGTLAIGAIQGEPEEQFMSGGVASQPMSEGAQGAYLAEVQNQIPNLPATNFQQLNQSLLFGTLSPQYLLGQAQVYS